MERIEGQHGVAVGGSTPFWKIQLTRLEVVCEEGVRIWRPTAGATTKGRYARTCDVLSAVCAVAAEPNVRCGDYYAEALNGRQRREFIVLRHPGEAVLAGYPVRCTLANGRPRIRAGRIAGSREPGSIYPVPVFGEVSS